MTKEEIISAVAKQKLIEEIVESVAHTTLSQDSKLKDLCQDLYLSLLCKSDDVIQQLGTGKDMRWYCTRAVLNNLRSKNSPYYYTYIKRQREEDPIDDYKI